MQRLSLYDIKDMATISLNSNLYEQAQLYAKADDMSVEEWVAKLIIRYVPEKKKYKMKSLKELSPELQALIGFAKSETVADDDDINGDKARMEFLTNRYSL